MLHFSSAHEASDQEEVRGDAQEDETVQPDKGLQRKDQAYQENDQVECTEKEERGDKSQEHAIFGIVFIIDGFQDL
jgi:hypothetical protein